MPRQQSVPYSYRGDPTVPHWDDALGLIVFDGQCVLCSRFARFVVRNDAQGQFLFTMAQSQLGQALYAHYALDAVDFETNLVILNGRLHKKLATLIAVLEVLGGPWRLAAVLGILPRPVADWLYDRVARNRYRLFGRYDACMVPSPSLQARIVD
ncbi:MAG: thiol-disulfide oxidoreductase DCC family protein [Gammaproteobacteria bacterium]